MLVCVVGEADREKAHGRRSLKCSGLRMARPGNRSLLLLAMASVFIVQVGLHPVQWLHLWPADLFEALSVFGLFPREIMRLLIW